MESEDRSPTFSSGTGPIKHGTDCDRKSLRDNPSSSRDRVTTLDGTTISGIPHRLVLVDRTVTTEIVSDGNPDTDTDTRRRSRAGSGTAMSVPGGRTELRWSEPLSEDGNLLTVTLHPQQRLSRNRPPILCRLTIDRTGWPTGRRNAFQRELDWAYTHVRKAWIADKTSATGLRHRETTFARSDNVHSPRLTLDLPYRPQDHPLTSRFHAD